MLHFDVVFRYGHVVKGHEWIICVLKVMSIDTKSHV